AGRAVGALLTCWTREQEDGWCCPRTSNPVGGAGRPRWVRFPHAPASFLPRRGLPLPLFPVFSAASAFKRRPVHILPRESCPRFRRSSGDQVQPWQQVPSRPARKQNLAMRGGPSVGGGELWR